MSVLKKTVCVFIVFSLFFSCSKQNDSDEKINKVKGFDFDSPVNKTLDVFVSGSSVYAPAGDAFDLDYSYVVPEEPPKPKRLAAIGKKSALSKKTAGAQKSGKKLSDYTTKYNESRKTFKEYIEAEPGSEESSFWEEAYPENEPSSETAEKKEQESYETGFYLWCDKRTRDSLEFKSNPLYMRFNMEPDKTTLKGRFILLDPYMEIPEENMELNGKELCIFNLPVMGGEKSYAIMVCNGVKSVSGQELSDDSKSFEFKVGRPSSYFKMCDSGRKLLEHQAPHKVAFKFKNLKGMNFWTLEKTLNPLKNTWSAKVYNAEEIHEIKAENSHYPAIETVDFDSLLDDGYGWITFTADYSYESYSSWRDSYEDEHCRTQMTVQVTDMGATARIGINRAIVLVSSLSKNQPVAGAEVSVLAVQNNFISVESDLLCTEPLVTGTTDKNGLADFEIPESKAKELETAQNVVLLIKKGKDKIAFFPAGNGYCEGLSKARKVKPVVFLFCDRGLYKPGEKITFRGIDKNLHMGHFSSYCGKYDIQLKNSSWNGEVVYGKLEGITSESGGFYGSFDLPENLVPGNYVLSYNRSDTPDFYPRRMYFQVRYFEGAKIQTEIDVPDLTYFGGDTISAGIIGTYLAGGNLSGAAVTNTWYRNPVRFSPDTPKTKGYTFGPNDLEGYHCYLSDEKGRLNADGKSSASFKTDKIESGTTFQYHLESSITDVSNQEITGRKAVTVHPARFYIGLASKFIRGFPEKGRAVEFSYLLVNPDGEESEISAVKGPLTYTLKKVSWELSNVNGVNDMIYSRYHKVEKVEKTERIKTVSEGSFSVIPESSGEYVLTVSGTDRKNNPVRTDYEFYVTGKDSFWFNRENSERIDLTFDKKIYNPGETAKVLLKSALPAGKYLITVEREGIFTSEVREFSSPCNVIDVPVAMNYVPVVYVCVSSYSERKEMPDIQFGEKDMGKPKGYYGEARLNVNPYVKAFRIDVHFDKSIYRPGETATVTVKAEKDGKPLPKSEITVMGVDRAVLDLVNYHVQNPLEYFYKQYNFSHCVTGGDSRDMLMDPVTYAAKNLVGGDALEQKSEEERRDFRPTAFFEPVLVTGEDGKAEFKFVVPSQLTTYRVTAVGVRGELFGIQEDEFGVRNPINVQAVQPRRLRVRDTAECGVLITNLGDSEVTLNVQIAQEQAELRNEDMASGLAVIPGKVFIDGESVKSVAVGAGQSEVIYFDVGALEAGDVDLIYTVDSDVFSERLLSRIKVEKSYSYDSVSVSGKLSGNGESHGEEKLVLPSWAQDGEGELSVTLDTSRLGLLSSAVQYVFSYPYGCIEQRISKLLPLVVFEEYISAFGLNSQIRDKKQVAASQFEFIQKYQHEDGGFGYWPESLNSDMYVSLRVAELCALALKHGWIRKEIMINIDRLENYIYTAVTESTLANFERIYGYYVLSSYYGYSFSSNIDSYIESVENKDGCNFDLVALAGLAYISSRNKDVHKAELCAEIIRDEIENFHSDEFLAHALKLFVALDPESELVDKTLMRLLISQKRGYWSNTRATAAVLDAVYDYIKARRLDAVDLNAKAQLAGVSVCEGEFKGAAAAPVTAAVHFNDERLVALPKDKVLDFDFTKSGTGSLYYSALMKYALPDELQNFRDKGIFVKYTLLDAESEKTVEPAQGSKVIELESGKTYKAKIQISTKKDRFFLALRAPVPSGAEILDTNFTTTSSRAAIKKQEDDSWINNFRRFITSQALYDNEVQFFWDQFEKGSYTLEFHFRAARRGVYPVPPVHAELMYEPEVYGRSDGYLFVIK